MSTNIGNKQIFGNNLAYYVEKSGRSQRELADELGVASSTFNDWVKGRKYPRIDKIEQLANIFGILKSDLIEEKTEKSTERDGLSKEMTELIDCIKSLPDDKIQILLQVAKSIK